MNFDLEVLDVKRVDSMGNEYNNKIKEDILLKDDL